MRVIDAEPFDRFLISVPSDVYDAFSFIQGAETVLNMVRNAPTIEDVKQINERQAELLTPVLTPIK